MDGWARFILNKVREASAEGVVGDFWHDNTYERNGITMNMFEEDGDFYINTVNKDGEYENFKEQALSILGDGVFCLVLLDMVMPGIDGLAAISLIRQQTPGTRIIIMTAYASVPNAVQAMQQGACDYLTKPFKLDTLLSTVRRHIQQAGFNRCTDDVCLDSIFQGLSNELRRGIIRALYEKEKVKFMDLVRGLEVTDYTKVNFHLKALKEVGFVQQDSKKAYLLTPSGHKAAQSLEYISKNL